MGHDLDPHDPRRRRVRRAAAQLPGGAGARRARLRHRAHHEPGPAILDASMGLYLRIMYAPRGLTRAQREMLAVVVSQANHCHY
ncbi:MAG: carboxymuconolactone decarboxylase family protein [Planctomycetota bacterium]